MEQLVDDTAAIVNNKVSRHYTPRVSIIVPCYNQGKFLEQAIESVLAQSYTNWECIIVDDGSTDETNSVVNKLQIQDDRIVNVRSTNNGVSAARNIGLAKMTGDLVQYLDADDYLERDKLRVAVEKFAHNSSIDVVVSDFRYFLNGDLNNQTYAIDPAAPEWAGPKWKETIPLLDKLLTYNFIPVCAPVIKSKAARAIGCWDTGLKGCEDWHYWLRASLHGLTFFYLPAPDSMALVRLHSESASHNNCSMLRQEIKMRGLLAPQLSGRLLRINRERALDALRRTGQRYTFFEKILILIKCADWRSRPNNLPETALSKWRQLGS